MTSPPTSGLWRVLRPLLFQLDPEHAHALALGLGAAWSRLLERLPGGERIGPSVGPAPRRVMGLDFANPIGLAAGLDKNAEAVMLWQALGFGFIEVGTVTAQPQPGNPRPRLFRLPADGALINRMGFNNDGAAAMARRLQALRSKGRLRVPLGVNIGKSKVTPAVRAAEDYRQSFERLGELADYVVVNISSPNTPGLRDLQTIDEVQRIVEALQAPNQRLSRPRPVLLKLAPDLANEDAVACAQAALAAGCAGLVLTNTTTCFDGLTESTAGMSGGLSGRPLLARSTAVLRYVRDAVGPGPALIGVGGVMEPGDAAAKLAAGADLVQVYTGLIYQGPAWVRRLTRELARDRSQPTAAQPV
jgi:dihydroorotate dehydrogenase